MLKPERLRDVLDYNPETGVLRWRVGGKGRDGIGMIAGYADKLGYRRIRVDGKNYLAHRLAWLHVHGAWPTDQVDHINNNPADNRLANLRIATNALNQANSRRRSHNKCGFKGVFLSRQTHKYRALIVRDGRQKYLGEFTTPEAAHAAYMSAAVEHFGEFARST